MDSKYNEDAMIQNLKDAGCDNDTVLAFMDDIRKGMSTEGLKRLSIHRRLLLEELHKTQKQIDCLDYLVYKIEQTGKMRA